MPVRRFLSHLQYEKRYSSHTLKAYENDLGGFSAYLSKEYGADNGDITTANHFQIRSWIVQLIESGIAPRSVNRKITALKSFFRFLLREKLVSQNPMVKIKLKPLEDRFCLRKKWRICFPALSFRRDLQVAVTEPFLNFFTEPECDCLN
ncbi:MAG: site-specific integrase [Bacteroidia bacterium]